MALPLAYLALLVPPLMMAGLLRLLYGLYRDEHPGSGVLGFLFWPLHRAGRGFALVMTLVLLWPLLAAVMVAGWSYFKVR